ncbi:hypothetical protein [Pectobacterium carotovorum]|uniref:hypothetical protein n=1 Tax=Pectobacterium carotovorum TaxID=554 RepID=UPI00057E630D|nr:hypothetical protein [Pectobacterium carotovorum]KHT34403.1 hypothetical protein RD01_05800 [Pectobacterium carotovorum subsp. carotovorum]
MKIIGIDRELSSEDEGMGDRYFILEDDPPLYWPQFFDIVHKEFFSMQKRRARIEGKNVIVCCLRDELQQQLNDLKVQCAQASKEAANYAAELEAERNAQEVHLAAQRKAADDDYDKLKFDD